MRKLCAAIALVLCSLPVEGARRRAVSPDNPAPTPDIAFVSERDGNSEIYVSNMDGTGVVRLTNNGAMDRDPAWSPDGKRIAFVSDRGGVGADIYIMDADGSNLVRRTRSGSAEGPAWSPDGTRIAFYGLRDGWLRIQVMSLDDDGIDPTAIGFELGMNVHPAWSSDGNRIAFVSDWRYFDGSSDLYVMNADGSELRGMVVSPGSGTAAALFSQPAWSPDGAKIAFAGCGYSTCYPSTLVVANADGSRQTTLRATSGYTSMSWSPDSSTLAYSYQACQKCVPELRYVSADGTRSGLIALDGHDPSWRPQPQQDQP